MAEYNILDSDLLCDEESKGLCFYDEEPILSPLLNEDQECFDLMIVKETEFLPKNVYIKKLRSGGLDIHLRRQAIDWMLKACGIHNFGELCLCLAVNYMDRFLSVYNLLDGITWAFQLVAVTCLSLAAKIDEVNVPSTINLQAGDPKHVFEAKTIRRMELLVLHYLGWKMRSYTPLHFIDYFIGNMNNCSGISNLIPRSTQVILTIIKGIDFLEFKPSEMAAAVSLYVLRETQTMDIDKALSNFKGVEKVVKSETTLFAI